MIAYIMLVAFQAAAVPAAGTAIPNVGVTLNSDKKIICKEEEETGTRLGGHKICMTKTQWRESYVQQRDALKHAQDNLGYVHN